MGPLHERALARFCASAVHLSIMEHGQDLRFFGRAPQPVG
jgi:hypothetical protein